MRSYKHGGGQRKWRVLGGVAWALGLSSLGCDPQSDPSAKEIAPQVDTSSLSFSQKYYLDASFFVYKNPSNSARKSALEGQVRLANGCLFVGDSVVIWQSHLESVAKDLIWQLKNGGSLNLRVGGAATELLPQLQEACGAGSAFSVEGKLNRPDWGCAGKVCGDACIHCRADDPGCQEPSQARCNAQLRCVGDLAPNACEDPNLRCAGLDEMACQQRPDCSVALGQSLNQAKRCREAETMAGCSQMDCGDDAVAYAKTPDGVIWRFATHCYPDGWARIEDVEVPDASTPWPSCQ